MSRLYRWVVLILVGLVGGSVVAFAGGAGGAARGGPGGIAGGAAATGKGQDQLLEGMIDFHCHSGPDVVGRLINDFEVVRQAKGAGMRAIVLKNHYTMTADRAQLAMQEVVGAGVGAGGGIQVFGGITLNLSVGGLNAEAVRKMVQMDGQRGRVVWLPTFDGEAQVKQTGGAGEKRAFVAVVKDGQPVPEMKEIFGLIAEHNLVLAMGHSSAAESLVLMEAAKKAGISRILVTHALAVPGGATDVQLKRMAEMGAIVECTWLAQLASAQTQPGGPQVKITVGDYARVIRLIGAEHVLISSDMGQMQNPSHVAAMRAFVLALKKEGVTDEQMDWVARKNAGKLLGME